MLFKCFTNSALARHNSGVVCRHVWGSIVVPSVFGHFLGNAKSVKRDCEN